MRAGVANNSLTVAVATEAVALAVPWAGPRMTTGTSNDSTNNQLRRPRTGRDCSGDFLVAESAEACLSDAAFGHLDAFAAELRGLFTFVAGYQSTDGVDDAPPRDVFVRVGQDVAHQSGSLRIAGVVGDVAVGHDLALA